MCRRPVTLGGGRRRVKFSVGLPAVVPAGLGTSKSFSLTQYSAQRRSMMEGS